MFVRRQMSTDDPEWGVMLFNQKDIDVSCQNRWWLAQNVPVHRFPWLTIGDHAIARRTEMSEASSLKFNLSDVNQNRRSVVHDVYQKMQRHWRKNTPPTDANRNSSSICCMLILEIFLFLFTLFYIISGTVLVIRRNETFCFREQFISFARAFHCSSCGGSYTVWLKM